MNPNMISEYELVQLTKNQFGSEKYFEEISFFRRSIDLVVIENNVLKTIEFKLKDWKKAIKQIVDHQVVADYSYLCMPKRNISNDMIEQLKSNGIGLYLYDSQTEKIELIWNSKTTSRQSKFYRNQFISRLEQL